MNSDCPVCKTQVEHQEEEVNDTSEELECRYSCRRCGKFRFEKDLSEYLQPTLQQGDIRRRAALSHWIRTSYEARKRGGHPKDIGLDRQLVNSIVKNSHPSPARQADTFIRWIGDGIKIGGEYVDVDQLAIQAIVGSATFEEFELVFRYVRDKGLIEHKAGAGNTWVKVTLSFAGWERYEELKRATSDSRKAFMAMQYGEEELDTVVEDVLKPAVKQTGFDLSRLDDSDQPAGLIDDRLRVAIRTSRFLIADLTHENRGAYWEAGYAEGLGKPVIYACEEKKFEELQTHFDTNHHLTIKWDAGDPHKLERAADKLKDTIRATLPAEAKLTDD